MWPLFALALAVAVIAVGFIGLAWPVIKWLGQPHMKVAI